MMTLGHDTSYIKDRLKVRHAKKRNYTAGKGGGAGSAARICILEKARLHCAVAILGPQREALLCSLCGAASAHAQLPGTTTDVW